MFNYLSIYNFFFFSSRRRHTRSKRDWSSDVCSSDLVREPRAARRVCQARLAHFTRIGKRETPESAASAPNGPLGRSEERRVGKECRSLGEPDQEKIRYV